MSKDAAQEAVQAAARLIKQGQQATETGIFDKAIALQLQATNALLMALIATLES